MVLLVFQIMSALGIALALLAFRARGSEIQFKLFAQIFVFICMIISHMALCMLDKYEVYNNWITFMYACALARWVYNVYKAYHNDYKLKITMVNVLFLSGFAFMYIVLGILSIKYTGQVNR